MAGIKLLNQPHKLSGSAELRDFTVWLTRTVDLINEQFETALTLPSYTVATLPDATIYTGRMIYVSDESGGSVPAFSDGTNWRRVTDRVIVS